MHSPLQRTSPYKVLSELWKVYAIIIQMFFNPRSTTVMWEQAPRSPNRKQWGFVCMDWCSPTLFLMRQRELRQLRALSWNQTSKVFVAKIWKHYGDAWSATLGYLTYSIMFNEPSSHLVLSGWRPNLSVKFKFSLSYSPRWALESNRAREEFVLLRAPTSTFNFNFF